MCEGSATQERAKAAALDFSAHYHRTEVSFGCKDPQAFFKHYYRPDTYVCFGPQYLSVMLFLEQFQQQLISVWWGRRSVKNDEALFCRGYEKYGSYHRFTFMKQLGWWCALLFQKMLGPPYSPPALKDWTRGIWLMFPMSASLHPTVHSFTFAFLPPEWCVF